MYDEGYKAYALLAQTATKSAISEHIRMMQTTPKQNICIDLLVSGSVHSFIDFFYLTHGHDQLRSKPDEIQNESESTDYPEEVLEEMRTNLVVVEQSGRKGNTQNRY